MSDDITGSPLLKEVLQRVSLLLPVVRSVDWSTSVAAQWRESRWVGQFVEHTNVDDIRMDDLLHIDEQKAALVLNTRQFLEGLPANNALLWGARGSGKSSLVHALLGEFQSEGLRLVEVNRHELVSIADIVEALAEEPYRFILFCDDLSFEVDDPSYKELKSALEGSIFKTATNVLIYATSNRRHLVPEHMSDNLQAQTVEGELHQGEAVEEKISLSDRFGIWLSFYPLKQADYLDVVAHWVRRLGEKVDIDGFDEEGMRTEALQWALARGVRNGRTAQYFARHWIGKNALQRNP